MDSTSTNNNFESILESSEPATSFTSSSSDTGFFSSIQNISLTTWILIILILAFLGFNVFAYLATGTQTIADIFGPLMEKILGTAALVSGEVIDVSAEGAKAVTGGTAKVIDSGLTAVQDITPNAANSGIKGQPINQQKPDAMQETPLSKALNTSQGQQQKSQEEKSQQQDYQANEASSSVHSAGKAGWCYVGNDRGFRTCAEVGVNDTCMSGDIFPSHEICMNPNLRV
jgi:hypothetical protein